MRKSPDWTALQPCVLASTEPLPDQLFTGYGFDGLDLVIGASGLSQFEAATGRAFSASDDGCYLILRQNSEGSIIATDPHGLCKLFFYQSRAGWAVSNSFAMLLDRVIALGWPVTPDYGVLDCWTLPPNCFGSAFTAQTLVREISLLNSAQHLVIRGGKAHVAQRWDRQMPSSMQGYEADLKAYLSLWLGRFLGMARSDQVALCAELTGGVDSRTATAFILHLRGRGLLAGAADVPIFCSDVSQRDHEVAQALASALGFPLTTPPDGQVQPLTVQQRFDGWRTFSLGMYVPLYIPPAQTDLRRVTIGGHGGERLRTTDTPPSIPAYLDEYAHKFRDKTRKRAMLSAYQHTLGCLGDLPVGDPAFDAFRCYFRRFHHSHLAQYTLRTPPLMAVGLEPCFAALDARQKHQGFVLYDIMHRLQPGLANLPYDDLAKSPDPEILSALGAAFDEEIFAGSLYCDAIPLVPTANPNHDKTPLALLFETYEAARAAPLTAGLAPSVIEDADVAIAQMKQTGKLATRHAFQPVHAVILQSLVAEARIARPRQVAAQVMLAVQGFAKRAKSRLGRLR